MVDLQFVDFALMAGLVRKEMQFGLPDDFSTMQSWTKVLGQIYICGTFSHATIFQPHPPTPYPSTMLDTCTL